MVILERGDVLAIPVGDGRAAFGYAVHMDLLDHFYLVVFAGFHAVDEPMPDLTDLVATGTPHLGAWTGTEQVEPGRWEVVGNVPVRRDFPMPAYKVAIDRPGNFYVEDWTGKRRRPATPEEAAALPNRSSFSGSAVDLALRGIAGLVPWNDRLGKLLLGGLTSQEAFPEEVC